jgi:hypothetical protein
MEIIKALAVVLARPTAYIVVLGALGHFGGQALKYLIA